MKTLVLLLFSLNVVAHPHHHSIALFDYNNGSKQLELSVKILTEDYKKIIVMQDAADYLQRHLVIEVNSVSLTGHYQGNEQDNEFMWFYYTFDVELSPGNNIFSVTNTILKSINKNQFNTTKITQFKKAKAHNFLFSEQHFTFIFQ